MSDILIRGMEMPIGGNETIIRIQPDGTVLDQYGHHLVSRRGGRDMSEDWRTKAFTDFCIEHNVTVIIDDEWKTREKRVMLRKGNYTVVRRICYDSILTILPTVLLNEMLQELQAEEGE